MMVLLIDNTESDNTRTVTVFTCKLTMHMLCYVLFYCRMNCNDCVNDGGGAVAMSRLSQIRKTCCMVNLTVSLADDFAEERAGFDSSL